MTNLLTLQNILHITTSNTYNTTRHHFMANQHSIMTQ